MSEPQFWMLFPAACLWLYFVARFVDRLDVPNRLVDLARRYRGQEKVR